MQKKHFPKLPAIGTRTLETEVLACGHVADGPKQHGKPMCRACFIKDAQEQVEAVENEYELRVPIRGSAKQIEFARSIRARKVLGIATRVADGTAPAKMLAKLDEFRTKSEAKWFIDNRLYRTKLKVAEGATTEDEGEGASDEE